MTLDKLLESAELPQEPFATWLNNNQAKGLPYHNNDHLIEVATYAFHIGEVLGFPNKAQKHMVVAGLLHDMNHLGKSAATDRMNIAAATKFVKENAEQLEKFDINIKELNLLIKATCVPVKTPKRITEMAICDADLMFWTKNDDFDILAEKIILLNKETGEQANFTTTQEFLANHRFYTTPAWNAYQKSIWKDRSIDFSKLDKKYFG